jgi:hypothetical protein
MLNTSRIMSMEKRELRCSFLYTRENLKASHIHKMM